MILIWGEPILFTLNLHFNPGFNLMEKSGLFGLTTGKKGKHQGKNA
jgi:hypothetical protein